VYLDPKVAVAAVVRREGRVLLLQRSQRDSAHGRWILPGGHVDRGEEATAAAAREVAEETGLAVEVEGLLGVYSYPGNPVVLIVYLARPVGGSLRPGAEALKLREFAPEEVPWDSLGFDSTRDALRDLWGPACPA
jgi:ADP-ribose pyrophosphatase YjhB (NUDIX family)